MLYNLNCKSVEWIVFGVIAAIILSKYLNSSQREVAGGALVVAGEILIALAVEESDGQDKCE